MSETAIFGPTAPEIRGFTQLREEKKHNLNYSKTTLQKFTTSQNTNMIIVQRPVNYILVNEF